MVRSVVYVSKLHFSSEIWGVVKRHMYVKASME